MKWVFLGRTLEVAFRRATPEECPKVAAAIEADAYDRGFVGGRLASRNEWLHARWDREPWCAFARGRRDGLIAAYGEPPS